MKKIILFVLFFLAVVWVCMSHASGPDALFGIKVDPAAKTVAVEVSSTGCTDKSYFSASLDGDVLTFKRIRRDACKAMPRPHTLVYTFSELGIKPNSSFRLGNFIACSDHHF